MAGGSPIPLSYGCKTGAEFFASVEKSELTITDLAELFGVTRRTIYAWINARELPYKGCYSLYLLDRAIENGKLPLADKFTSKWERLKAIKSYLFT